MKKHIFILNTFILTGLLILSGCNDFLDEPTYKTTAIEIKTVEQLDALLGNYHDNSIMFSSIGFNVTDDNELNISLYDANPSVFYSLPDIQLCTWDMEGLAQTYHMITCWEEQYSKIFIANVVLENLRKVSGDDALKAELEAEAHLLRAYSYMELANIFCLPYTDANKEEMGLPLKQSTSFEEDVSRKSLEETYNLIEADLNAAAAIKNHLVQNGRVRSWRGNTAAVNAVFARYWLSRNDYGKALTFANNALKEYNTLVDYNTEMHYSDIKTIVTINGSNPDKKEEVEILYPYTADSYSWDMTLTWKECYYYRYITNLGWNIPSKELLSLYEENPYDLRYKYFIIEHESYRYRLADPAYDYPGYNVFGIIILNGPSVPEMYLIKAECLARLNKISDAMIALNTLRKTRIDKDHYFDETAANKEEAVSKIINERRREMPFSARWADIRRYNNNEDSNDDVGDLKRIFYPYTTTAVLSEETPIEYTLSKKDSRRWAFPIPEREIITSNRKIKQNTY